MASQTGSILDQLMVTPEQQEKLQTLDKKRVALSEANRKDLTAYEQSLNQMLDGKSEVKVQSLSLLDAGIQRTNQYKGEISDLALSLTTELNGLGQLFGDLSQYKGLEAWVARFGFASKADSMRMSRVKSADVKQNLQTILDYGTHMVRKLHAGILENMECYAKIEASVKRASNILNDTQPIYKNWRSQREQLEREMSELDVKMAGAEEELFAKLSVEKTELEGKVHEAKTNEDYNFTIVNNAKDALPIMRGHLKAYADSRDALLIMKTDVEQRINHVTQVYLAVPTAIKTALSVKAASQYHKGMNYATDISTDAVFKSTAGVLAEVSARRARPLIEPEKLELYRKAQEQMEEEFRVEGEALKGKYSSAAAPAVQ